MTSGSSDITALFARFVEHHVVHGEALPIEVLAEGRADLVAPLAALVARYLAVNRQLDEGLSTGVVAPADALDGAPASLVPAVRPAPAAAPGVLPVFEGFRTIERLGAGGMGEVYKVEDLRLGRLAAAKVLRPDRPQLSTLSAFLREARALALFSDRRIVQIYEFRPDASPPVIVMELVDGFELGRVGRSLEPPQRARLLAEVCEALARAHALGVQHRDLKPSNILVDTSLTPRIVDFGLSDHDPSRGHLVGTLSYLAPEQLDPGRPIDARTDVYALGVILYELSCGVLPYRGTDAGAVIAQIAEGRPRLPVEIDPGVPAALQAIALTAMSRDPAERYASAGEMARDLRRFVDGLPILARPAIYATTLGARVGPHLAQIAEWERLRLIHPHEAAALGAAYRDLDSSDEDWIVENRRLTSSQVALYLGAFLLCAGSLFYFAAHRFFDAVHGLLRPFVALGVPFVGLNLAGFWLHRRGHRAVAVAFLLAAVGLLPLFLLILFRETNLLAAPPGSAGQLFDPDILSNRQLQVTTLVGFAWAAALALWTRTVALSTVAAALGVGAGLAILADFGLRTWIADSRFDRLALHLSPLVPAYAAAGLALERKGRVWFARPFFLASALLLVAVLELMALEGRLFGTLGISIARLHQPPPQDARLLDTLIAMTLNGAAIYAIAWIVERRGSPVMRAGAGLLYTLSPFAILQPLGLVSKLGTYSPRYDWWYLTLALVLAWVSQVHQRRSFYYAGVLNTGAALFVIASHNDWFDDPAWAIVLILAGLAALAGGYALAQRERATRDEL